eukprot:5950943-Pyramimonas_sp.AAC.2
MANKFPSFLEYARAAMGRAGVEQQHTLLSDAQVMEVRTPCTPFALSCSGGGEIRETNAFRGGSQQVTPKASPPLHLK